MNQIYVSPTITITTKNRIFSIKHPLLILIAITGCICTFYVCFSMINPEYNKTVFWFVTIISALCTCLLSLMPKQLHLTGLVPLLIGAVISLVKKEKFVLGAKLFYNYYYNAIHHTEVQFYKINDVLPIDRDNNITWFLCCCSIILCCLISRSVIRKPYFIAYFFLTFFPIEFGLYEGLSMNIPAILMLVATWFCVLSLQLAMQKKKKAVANTVSSSNSSKCGIAGLAITLAAVMSSVFICNAFNLTTDKNIQQKRSEIRKEIEEFRWENVIESVSRIGISLGIFEDPDSRKLGTKNSISYNEEDEVQITLSELPEHSIYLKNYTGSVYENNSWSVIPNDEWKSNEKLEALFSQFECVPQILPFMSNQSIYGSENNAQIKIQPIDKTNLTLQPYASYGESCGYVYDYGCVVKNNEEYDFTISLNQNFYNISSLPLNYYYLPSSGFNLNDKTTSNFFNKLDADVSQESLCVSSVRPPYLKNSKYKTQALQASLTESYAYRIFAHEKYAAPVFSKPLEEVYSSLPSELIDISKNGNNIETLGAIRKYLAQVSEYTTAPGETPSTRDFVNYFLLENNKGYCMHYATAGVLLARYFGIPARYCEGYIVSEDMMSRGKKNGDGSVTINIPDSASHAWCEYFIDGYGWVPYELTPGYYENISESENLENIDEITTEPPEQTEIQTEPIAETETTTVTSASTISTEQSTNNGEDTIITSDSDQLKQSGGTGSSFFRIFCVVIIIIILVIAVISIFILSRKYAINKRNQNFNNPNTIIGILSIYDFLMILLKYQSICPENSQLLDFAAETKEKLSESGFDGNGAAFIIKTALAADMGGKTPSNDDILMSIKYVNSLAEFIGKRRNPFEHLIMKYIHHFF